MKREWISIVSILILLSTIFCGCSGSNTEPKAPIPDGVYVAEFDTDSSMFRVNEAHEGKGTLTVEDGRMTIHISLGSKNIVNLYPGLAEDAKGDEANWLQPTEDTVTYSDGWVDEVYGFDVPVPVLDEEFDVALIGKKGKWYDHKVVVLDPEPMKESTGQSKNVDEFEEGTYMVDCTFEGGSGRAMILSPVELVISEGTAIATVSWDSPNYDYMVVDGEKYLPVNEEGNSVFEIPIKVLDESIGLIGDTVAMSKPHEIEYTITLHSDTMELVK